MVSAQRISRIGGTTMSRGKKTARKYINRNKEIEMNVSDDSINAEELKPFQNQKKIGKNRGSRNPKGKNGVYGGCRPKPRFTKSMPSHNDWQWYAKNSTILQQVASFSFNNPVGDPIESYLESQAKLPTSEKIALNVDLNQYFSDRLPGVCALDVVPCPGKADSFDDAVNNAAYGLYAHVRFANSGAKNYDSPDLMMYFLAMDSLYYMWNFGKRAFGIIKQRDQFNRYLNRVITEACGFDFNDLSNNMNNFVSKMNLLAAEIDTFNVPDTMPFMIRHSWLFSNVFKDSPLVKSQFYVFRPKVYYTYEETEPGKPGYLKANVVPPKLTTSQYISILEDMLAKVTASEDVGIMSGDVLKAYNNGNMFRITVTDANYTFTPVYEPNVLSQIENATIVGMSDPFNVPNPAYNMDIKQSTNGLIQYDPHLLKSTNRNMVNMALLFPRLINMHVEDPTPEQIIVATRLCSMLEFREEPFGDDPQLHFQSLGTEWLCGATVYDNPNGISSGSTHIFATGLQDDPKDSPTSALRRKNYMAFLNIARAFHAFPTMQFIVKDDETIPEMTVYTNAGYVLETDNVTTMQYSDLAKQHTAAIMSEFDIPVNGTF